MATHEATLAAVEAQLAELGDAFAREAPEQYAKLRRVLEALRAGEASDAEVQGLALELFRWQVGLHRQGYSRELEPIARAAKETGSPVLLKAREALVDVLDVLARMERLDFPAPPAALHEVEQAIARAGQALEAAAAAAPASTAGIPMRPVAGPIVSSTGVPLKAVEPRAVKAEKKPAPKLGGGWATTAQLAQLMSVPSRKK